jgi:MFS family permease
MTNGGTIADIWDAHERGTPMAVFSLTIFMGPCLGPLLGGWISVGTHNWRWIYWVLFAFLGVVFVGTCFAPETYAPILLKRKAARLNKEHNTTTYKSDLDLRRVPMSTTLKIALTRPFIFMFCEPIVLCMSIYLSFIYSLLYLLFFAFPIAFEEVRGWNEGMTGTAFIAVMVSFKEAKRCSISFTDSRLPARYPIRLYCAALPGSPLQARDYRRSSS